MHHPVRKSLQIYANLGSRRQMRVQRSRLIRRILEFIVTFSPNAKTHQRCAVDLQAAESAADLYSNS